MKCKLCGKQYVWMKLGNKFIDVDGASLSEEDINWLVSHPNEWMEIDIRRHKNHSQTCKGKDVKDSKQSKARPDNATGRNSSGYGSPDLFI